MQVGKPIRINVFVIKLVSKMILFYVFNNNFISCILEQQVFFWTNNKIIQGRFLFL